MEYREIIPIPQLAPYVECYWSIRTRPDKISVPRPILPDGCADIIFNFGPPIINHHANDTFINTNPAFIVGNMTRAVASQPDGYYNLIAIRFHPGGLRAFVNLPLHELTDRVVSLDTFQNLRYWQEQLAQAQGLAGQCNVLNTLLLQNLSPVYNPAVIQALKILQAYKGNIRIAHLAATIGRSQKHLERTFKDLVGLSPKQTAGIIRFRHVAHLLRHNHDEESLLHLATDNGFTDHAHFTKSFKEFAGVTPQAFAAGNA